MELLRRRAARTSLLAFTTYTYPEYEPSWHHRLLCAYLDRFAAGLIDRLMVFMPPQHGKSELCSRRLPAYLLGRDPDTRIIACSHTAGLASDMNRDVQRIVDDDPYHRLFQGTQMSGRNVRTVAGPMPLRNSEVFEVVGRRGSYRSAGVGSAIVGRGFDVGIIDDPMAGREAADSPTQRAAVWKWYTGDFYTRRGKDARILVIMTRWHPEDLAGRLLKQQEADPKADRWTVLRLPAVCEVEGDGVGSPRFPGDALWPERYPLAALDATKAANPYDWDSQYQQTPRNPGSTEWPETLFDGPGFWFEDWPPLSELIVRTMALDPSKGSDAKTSDWQALVLHGRTADGTEWVEADLARRPITAPRSPDGTPTGEGMVESAIDRAVWFQPHGFAVESNQFQLLLRIPIEAEMDRRKVEVPLYLVENRDPKPLRIRRLGPPLSRRRVRFRRTPGTRELVEQLKQFPTGGHDDGPDSLEVARRLSIELYNERYGG